MIVKEELMIVKEELMIVKKELMIVKKEWMIVKKEWMIVKLVSKVMDCTKFNLCFSTILIIIGNDRLR